MDPYMTTKDEVTEQVSRLDVLVGSRAYYVLTQFVKCVIENYKKNNSTMIIDEVKQKGESLP